MRLNGRRAEQVRERAQALLPGAELIKYAVFHVGDLLIAKCVLSHLRYYHSSPAAVK